jgi:FixJ family two-component response regulator
MAEPYGLVGCTVTVLPNEPNAASRREPLIAIVDDDPSVRNALSWLMESVGYALEAFSSASEFLASPQLRSAACLIADAQMPEMTGIELYRSLIGSGHAIPTILITAHPDNDVRARVLKDGAVGYLSKPFSEAALLGCVHSALEHGNPRTKRAKRD